MQLGGETFDLDSAHFYSYNLHKSLYPQAPLKKEESEVLDSMIKTPIQPYETTI